MAKPDKLLISHEDFEGARFEHIGHLPNGNQFIALVTGAFPTGMKYYYAEADDWSTKKQWLAVIHLFDKDGNYLKTESRLGGLDSEGRDVAGTKAWEQLIQMFAEMFDQGTLTLGDIQIRPFSVEIDGVTHGLFYGENEDVPVDSEDWYDYVMFEPLDLMFHPPWDSGSYSS
jgi:hypothetical protein